MTTKHTNDRCTLGINDVEYTIHNRTELQDKLVRLPTQQFLELWLTLPPNQCISALINHAHAILLFGRYDGDAGLCSRSHDGSAGTGQVVAFYLSNGQRDTYPVNWTVPTHAALEAFDYAFIHQRAAPWIVWHDDDV